MKLKLYRHTKKHVEVFSDGSELVTYSQTGWSSVYFLVSGNAEVVYTEEKEIEIPDQKIKSKNKKCDFCTTPCGHSWCPARAR